MKYDIIIIGSGIGGLTCGSVFSAQNKKVLIIEKNELSGGCMQSINKDNWNWSFGMQYMLKYGEKSIYNILLQIVTNKGVKFSKLDTKFQLIDYYNAPTKKQQKDKEKFSFPIFGDGKLMRKALIKEFPEEKRKIKKYYRYLNRINRKVMSLPLAKLFPFCIAKFIYPIIMWTVFPIMSISLYPLVDITIQNVVEKKLKITNQNLQDILYSYWHFAGMSIDKAPFLFWAVAHKMADGGAYFPNGGAKSIISAFVETIEKNGGKIETNKQVNKIIIKNNKATGIELIDGTIINAKKIISNAGIAETITNLIPKAKWNKRIEKINYISNNKIPSSNSEIVFRVGLKGDLSKFNIKKTTYRYVIGNSSEMNDDPTKKDWIPSDLTFSFFTIYDESYNNKPYQCVDILEPTRYSYFKNLTYQSKEYNKIVDNITKIILNKFNEEFPGIKNFVEYSTLTSPLSAENKTSHFKGSVYGRNIKKAGYPTIQPRTGIKNLYFTGEDIFAGGINVINGLLSTIVAGGLFRTVWTLFKMWRKNKHK